MDHRDAHIDAENPGSRSQRKFPTRPTGVETAGNRLDGQHASILAVGCAGVDYRPAIRGQLVEARVEVIYQIAEGRSRRLSQRGACRINVARRGAVVRVLHPQRFHLVIGPRVKPGLPGPTVRVNLPALRIGNAQMQMRPRRVARRAAGADNFTVRNIGASSKTARLHGRGAKVPVPGIVTVWVPQADINPQIAAVVLRVIPARVNNSVGIGSG